MEYISTKGLENITGGGNGRDKEQTARVHMICTDKQKAGNPPLEGDNSGLIFYARVSMRDV
jgi:hypothetical protein